MVEGEKGRKKIGIREIRRRGQGEQNRCDKRDDREKVKEEQPQKRRKKHE